MTTIIINLRILLRNHILKFIIIVVIYKKSIVQNTDPVFLDPDKKGLFSFRTHFYAPAKYIFGIKTDTFKFNITLVLLSTILLYLVLYYELLGKVVRFIENFKIRK